MMKLSTLLSLLFLCNAATAFTIPQIYPTRHLVTRFTATSDDDAIASDAAKMTVSDDDDEAKALLMKERWMAQLQSTEVQQVRLEMVQKYVELGKTPEEAEIEVDKFLSDPEQSLQYLEMRRYAKSQELVGPELLVQLAGAFALGLFATVGSKYFGVSTQKDLDIGIKPSILLSFSLLASLFLFLLL